MKADNLKILQSHGINVPPFITVAEGEKIDLSFSSAELFAVRSSFKSEDTETSSFAGQFETYLNVKRADVEACFEKVLKSGDNHGALLYAKNRGITADNSKSVAIIQEMIIADYSGVLFTVNPIGILNEMTAVVGIGTGNLVVEDKIDTTTYYYNKDDGIYFFEKNGNSPELASKILEQLFEQGRKIESIFGTYMDIEFAIKDNIIYFLQARPVTTINSHYPIILDNSNIVESYPGVSLPLTQSFVKEIYYKIFSSCVKRMTRNPALANSLDTSLQNMTDVANWRIYYRISNWYCVLKLLPFSKKLISIWQDMLGVENKIITDDSFIISPKTKAVVTFTFLYYLIKTPKEMKALALYFDEQYKLYIKRLDEINSITELLMLYEEIKDALCERWDLTLINDMYAFIFTALSGNKNKEYISNIRNLESMQPVTNMVKLAEIGKKYGLDSTEYLEKRAEYIKLYGDRCLSELKLETETYRTKPALVDERINLMLSGGYDIKGQQTEEKRHFNPFVKKAKLGIANRETSRMNRTRIFGLARSIMLKLGDILTSQNRLESSRDIFYLFYNEISDNSLDFKPLVNKRKHEYIAYSKLPAFSRLVFSDRVINRHMINIGVGLFSSDGDINGVPASGGIAEGEILVIDEPSQNILTKGKIIVTKMTDPGWVFLIENALGIIAEKGSLLSHTAIIARELKKPSVVNVQKATKIFKSGDYVRLNGSTGEITILQKTEEQ